MSNKKKHIKDIWGWLDEITLSKSSPDELTSESWDSFNSYMIHRFISMDPNYIELANYAQTIPYDNKVQTYQIYKEMIPKKKVWLKYIKGKTKKYNPQLVEHISDYFECGSTTANEYLGAMKKKEVINLLEKMGMEKDDMKKLLK